MAQITKDTGIIEAVQKYPQIIEIFQQYGLGCIGCMAAHFETIGQGAGAVASAAPNGEIGARPHCGVLVAGTWRSGRVDRGPGVGGWVVTGTIGTRGGF